MDDYTPEPWSVVMLPSESWINGSIEEPAIEAGRPGANDSFGDIVTIMSKPGTHENAIANARRIVACVNACQGFETDRLERLSKDPLDASGLRLALLVERTDERDKALDIIRALIEWSAAAHSSYGPDCQCADCKKMRMILTKCQDLIQARKGKE